MIDTQDHLGPCGDGTGGKPSEPRKKIDHFHVFVLLLQSPTQVALKCVSHQGPTTARLSRGTLTCAHSGSTLGAHQEHTCESTCEGTGGASVGARRTGRRGASARHPAMRWACRRGVGAGRVRERPGRPCLPHTSLMTKLASAFCMLRRENQRTIAGARRSPPSPRVRQFHLPRVVLGVFSGHGHHGHHGHP